MRLKPLVLIVPLFAALLAPQARACSQCMCGTPFPADALGGVVPMQVRYGFEERYLSKANALDEEPGTEREREHRISGFVLWRTTNRLALLGRLPYNVKELKETPLGGETTTQTAKGLGDAEAMALIGLAHTTGAYPTVFGMVLGVTAPTGSNDKKNGAGERLDAHLQPGTGAWSGTAGLNVAVSLGGGGIVDGSVLGRVNGTNSHDYRYGNVLLFNAGYTSPAQHGVRLLAQVNGRSAKRDQLEEGTVGENTGGTVVYLSPGARWQTGLGLDIDGAVQIPVVENLFGEQDEHATGRIALSLSR
jgi:hypothetical protein